MAVPKQRQTSSRGKRRRGGHRKIKAKKFIKCSNCGREVLSHRVCSYCGHYKGKKIVNITD